jgi:hypothetical protein
MNRNLIVVVLAACILTGCKQGKTSFFSDTAADADSTETTETFLDDFFEEEKDELISEEPMPVAAEELFDDFFFNFASNRRLQIERVRFPLVVRSDARIDTLERQDWQMEHFFMHQEEYTLFFDSEQQMELVSDTTVSEVVVEKIFLSQAFVHRYLFHRENGQWKLSGIEKQTLSLNHNASFLSFYRRFVTDSVFCHQSLNDEIAFVGPDPDDEFSQMEGVITPDFWEAFAPDLPHDTIYNIVYGHPSGHSDYKIFVMRGIANGQEVTLTFHRDKDTWKLLKLTE